MLCEAGMDNIWKDQVCHMNICNKFKTLIFTNYSVYCIRSINCPITNPKLRTYCKFKHEFSMEPYLLSILDFKIRRQLSRFRLSNHSLKNFALRRAVTKDLRCQQKKDCVFCVEQIKQKMSFTSYVFVKCIKIYGKSFLFQFQVWGFMATILIFMIF